VLTEHIAASHMLSAEKIMANLNKNPEKSKIATTQPRFERFRRKLARWRSSTLL